MSGAIHSELMPGDLLGKYRIERMLGHGGMATVYLAVQEGTGLEVALKVLTFRGDSNRSGGDVARFIREARLAGGIRHPHWVSVYETGFDAKNNLYYIAMERMHASLAQKLRAHGPMEETEAISVVEQVALALDKAYETQMVHRDIKPANILYNSAGVCKLTDFGIAKSSRNEETQLTLREAVFGTPAYMSPEQARDARMVDARSDIYSLGTVFFELLSGERPYQGETPVQVLAQVITDDPPPDVRSRPKARKIHSDTARLIACMMAKDPAARPQTPKDLIARLRQLKAHVPYAKPAEQEEEPPYDDSTIMDPTHPPPTDLMDGGFSSNSSTVRVPTGSARHTGVWDRAPTGNGGGGEEDNPEDLPNGVGQTSVMLPTSATQAVRDGTVATVASRGGESGNYKPGPVRPSRGKRKPGAGKAWMATGAMLVALTVFFAWAARTDLFPRLFEGASPAQNATLVFLNPNGTPVHVRVTGGLEDDFEVAGRGEERRSVQAGTETSVRYHAPYSGLFREHGEHNAKSLAVTLAAGGTEEVRLELTAAKGSAPETATLRFHNPYDVQLHVETTGGLADRFDVGPKATVEKTAKAGETTTIRCHALFTTLYEETTPAQAKQTECRPKTGQPEDVELVLTPAKGSAVQHASLRFHNPNDTPVHVETSGGSADRFDVEAGATVERSAQAGVATIIRYHAPYSGLYAETEENPGQDKRIPEAGADVAVELALTPKLQADGGRATLRFHNPLDTAVSVEASGGLSDRFEVAPKGTETRTAQAGKSTVVRFHAPYSGLYEAGETNVAGAATIELSLVRKDRTGMQAVLRLGNPNDAAVRVLLSGGREDEIWVEPGAEEEVSVRSGVKTELRCYAMDGQYAENSPETAKGVPVVPKGGEPVSVALKLTKRAKPVVQLSNGGGVALAVRVDGESALLPAGESKTFQVAANRKIALEWEAGEEEYLEGGRAIGPYDWNQRERVSIVPERRTPPSLRVRNLTPLRGMDVTVIRESDGSTVEKFTLEKSGHRVVELPGAGRYRVRTQAQPDKRNDNYQDPGYYDATDALVECTWGRPTVLDCTADLKRNPDGDGPSPDPVDFGMDALASALNAAKMHVDSGWSEHGVDGAVVKIRTALQTARNFAGVVEDVDSFVGKSVPYGSWAESVQKKRNYPNDEWRRIVEATDASGNWTEFFKRFPATGPGH